MNRSVRLAFCSWKETIKFHNQNKEHLHTFDVFAFATCETSPKRSVRFLIASVKTGVVDADCSPAVFFVDVDLKKYFMSWKWSSNLSYCWLCNDTKTIDTFLFCFVVDCRCWIICVKAFRSLTFFVLLIFLYEINPMVLK